MPNRTKISEFVIYAGTLSAFEHYKFNNNEVILMTIHNMANKAVPGSVYHYFREFCLCCTW